jgi:uncharacterized protein YraI
LSSTRRAAPGHRFAAPLGALLLILALMAPLSVAADTSLVPGDSAVTTRDVALTSNAGYDAGTVTTLAAGTPVVIWWGPVTAGDGSVWYEVGVQDTTSGFLPADALARGAGSGTDPTPDPGDGGSDPVPSAEGSAVVTTLLNLRAEPSYDAAILAVMPAGATVGLAGEAANGFRSLVYDGTYGWAAEAYLDIGGTAPPPDAEPTPDPGGGGGRSATTTADLNLRAGPSYGDAILAVMPAGSGVVVTGDPQNGFYPVSYAGQGGWALGDYLSFGGDGAGDGDGDGDGTGSAPPPSGSGGSGIVWPFASGTSWEITQGYNGPYSHYNSSSTYQYYYSFDLATTDGDATGQPIYSPVSGTIRWIDYSTGGLTVDLGNGYAVAWFHTYVDGGLAAGQSISQGQYVGSIAAPGDGANAGFPHLHFTVWQTSDGGNWDRVAVPFTGANAISGQDFPDIGGSNQHAGTIINV